MRVFIGIDLADDWREALVAGCDVIRTGDMGWAGEKWVPAENLHVTLKFLGDIPDDAAAFLGEDLERALADVKGFRLPLLQAVHPVPERRKATMLWTTLRDPEGECERLVSRIEDVAVDYGVVPDSKRFNPHITLVRTRNPRAFIAEDAPAAVVSNLGPDPSMSVENVTVFSSRLTKARPYYKRLAVVRLAD